MLPGFQYRSRFYGPLVRSVTGTLTPIQPGPILSLSLYIHGVGLIHLGSFLIPEFNCSRSRIHIYMGGSKYETCTRTYTLALRFVPSAPHQRPGRRGGYKGGPHCRPARSLPCVSFAVCSAHQHSTYRKLFDFKFIYNLINPCKTIITLTG